MLVKSMKFYMLWYKTYIIKIILKMNADPIQTKAD